MLALRRALNEEGERVYPLKWNLDFIQLPVVCKERQHGPSVTDARPQGTSGKRERIGRLPPPGRVKVNASTLVADESGARQWVSRVSSGSERWTHNAENRDVQYRAGLVRTSTALVGTVVGGCANLPVGKTLSYMTGGATGT
jgi:hypothetical protein